MSIFRKRDPELEAQYQRQRTVQWEAQKKAEADARTIHSDAIRREPEALREHRPQGIIVIPEPMIVAIGMIDPIVTITDAFIKALSAELYRRKLPLPDYIKNRNLSREDWEHLARITEVPNDRISGMADLEIFHAYCAWCDRGKIKAELFAVAALEARRRDGRYFRRDRGSTPLREQSRTDGDFLSPGDTPVVEAKPSMSDGKAKNGGRSKTGKEAWRRARSKLLDRLQTGTLPTTLRDAAKLIEETYTPTRDAAIKTPLLAAHFNLKEAVPPAEADGDLLSTLSGTMARQFSRLPQETREALEQKWNTGDKREVQEVVKTLTNNPDAGSTGDVPYIDEAYGQRDDSPE